MPFTAKLLTLSPWLVLFLINLTFIVPFLMLLYIVKHCWSHQSRKSHNDVTSAIFNRAGAIFGVMLHISIDTGR
jgi:glycopeptide antibiotics resistance protein